MRKPQSRRHSSFLTWALLVSLGVHGLAALWLSRAKTPPPVAPQRTPLQVSIIERKRPAPVTPVTPPPAPPQAPVVRRPVTPKAPAPVVTAPAPAKAERPAEETDTPRAGSDQPVLATDMPTAAPGSDVPRARPDGQRGPVSLTPSASALAQTAGNDLPPEEETEDARGIQAPRRVSPEQLVRETAQDALALSRATRGAVHPYFQKLGQALFDAWKPEPVVAKLGTETLRSRGYGTKDFLNSWQQRAEAYGKSGSPLAGVTPGFMPRTLGGEDLTSNFSTQVALESQAGADVKSKRRMLMRLTQDRDGHLLELRMLKPSALPEIDRGALANIRAAGGTLPEPPQEALGSRTQLVSLWELELVRGWDTHHRDVSFDFAGAIAESDYFKHLKLTGAQ
ncbi:TonB C-terminal domain-containing protein [Myxococcaceae bacterium JPH2]|nr:TonB C-terminal domain-containing protein [Myxococcaceae bacterium JPH2]